jgi:nucleolar protein 58
MCSAFCTAPLRSPPPSATAPRPDARSISLNNFVKFEDSTEAVAAAAAMIEGKVGKTLKKLLKKAGGETLGVADAKLGASIKEKLSINCIYDSSINELLRGIRGHAESFLDVGDQMKSFQLGLAHGLSRYKLKFSPDKVDTMIVQAIGVRSLLRSLAPSRLALAGSKRRRVPQPLAAWRAAQRV